MKTKKRYMIQFSSRATGPAGGCLTHAASDDEALDLTRKFRPPDTFSICFELEGEALEVFSSLPDNEFLSIEEIAKRSGPPAHIELNPDGTAKLLPTH